MLSNLLTLNPSLPNLLFQSLAAGLISFLICFFGIKYFLCLVKKKQICTQPIRDDGPESHLVNKKNTPTMGGIFIILGTLISCLFASSLSSYILICLLVMLSFSLIGFVDDYMKVTKKGTKGFRGSVKLVIQFLIVGLVILWLQSTDSVYFSGQVAIPFSNYFIDLKIFYIFFATLVIVGSANAVNLTDGLDGLVSVPSIVTLSSLCLIIYLIANPKTAQELDLTHIKNVDELIVFCVALIGAIAAFLVFNFRPARIFMGDVGSLGIGGSLGVIAVILKQELVFGIIALLFVVEALSVILQVTSYKLRKKRIFLMAPLHHHFEKLGWKEKRVVKRFWIASVIFSGLGLLGLML